jgi:hypothetical protein
MSTSKKAFWEDDVAGLAEAKESDDLLHPHLSKAEPGYALTETQYLGFNIPEHDIHAIGYLWYHPHLKTVMGGIAAWQGFKSHPLQSELWDYVSYMSDDCLKDDLWKYRMENGYEVTTVKPLVSHRIQYENTRADNMIDVSLEALAPPVMLGTGMHFEQPMKTTGQIRLRGRTYDVEGTTVRDRSFGQLRNEYLVPLPPLAWMNAAFSENFAFGCTAFDDPNKNPEWVDSFRLPNNNPLRGGWIYKDGIASRIVQASKVTIRRKGSFFPDRIELTVVDDQGRTLEITGHTTAGVNWQTWHNMDSNINLTRWECDGEVTYGDYQEFLWPDYIREFHP